MDYAIRQKQVALDIKKQVDRYLFLCVQFIRRSLLLYVVGLTRKRTNFVLIPTCAVCLNCQHFCVSIKKNEDESAEFIRVVKLLYTKFK